MQCPICEYDNTMDKGHPRHHFNKLGIWKRGILNTFTTEFDTIVEEFVTIYGNSYDESKLTDIVNKITAKIIERIIKLEYPLTWHLIMETSTEVYIMILKKMREQYNTHISSLQIEYLLALYRESIVKIHHYKIYTIIEDRNYLPEYFWTMLSQYSSPTKRWGFSFLFPYSS